MIVSRLFRVTGALAVLAPTLVSCRSRNEPDAYGNFETTEVVVSAQASGQLLWFTPDDGQRLTADALVGVVEKFRLTSL